MRVGIGYDIHRMIEGRKLFLGGIEIPYIKGFLAHSDGDILLHALCDAILGAAALGDIGTHFPDTDIRYSNISSAQLLKEVLVVVRNKGFRVHNVDTVIIMQEPKLVPFKDKIRNNVATLLGIDVSFVSVKAKTQEGLGPIGNNEAAACYATVSLDTGG